MKHLNYNFVIVDCSNYTCIYNINFETCHVLYFCSLLRLNNEVDHIRQQHKDTVENDNNKNDLDKRSDTERVNNLNNQETSTGLKLNAAHKKRAFCINVSNNQPLSILGKEVDYIKIMFYLVATVGNTVDTNEDSCRRLGAHKNSLFQTR